MKSKFSEWLSRPVATYYDKWKFLFLISFAYLFIYFSVQSEISDFRFTHFLFNYEYEFLKRGLVGEIWRLAGVSVTPERVAVFSLLSFGALFVLMAGLFYQIVRLEPDRKVLWLFFCLLMTHSAFMPHFYVDLGRFDTQNYFLFLIAIFLIFKLESHFLAHLLTGLLLAVMLLIHEAVFFMFFPTLALLLYFRFKCVFSVGLLSVITVYITYAAGTYGQIQYLDPVSWYESLTQVYGESVSQYAVNIMDGRGLIENIATTFERSLAWDRFAKHISMILIFWPFYLLMWRVWKGVKLKVQETEGRFHWHIVLFVALVSPLALYPLGHDHFRWWAIGLTNFWVLVVVMCIKDRILFGQVKNILESSKKALIWAIGLSILAGPLGTTSAFVRRL
ncbi:hypothetical protein [Thiomicrorhabdus xiamenensis]|uniref:EpsG family protein n=1 Tax=Thiomicrorhabdus xiamenensis TaxID=2739063 RepID=A0A7D4NKV1_9GAMM|nr:hypothetical protein [Thiomicrorhabdus xiamenensis]QKI88634.1 hypothetical protein HQN79_03125 [Thiomicrorhabdus xiamenensis]